MSVAVVCVITIHLDNLRECGCVDLFEFVI